MNLTEYNREAEGVRLWLCVSLMLNMTYTGIYGLSYYCLIPLLTISLFIHLALKPVRRFISIFQVFGGQDDS